MTRARVISGREAMSQRVETVIGQALDSPKDPVQVKADAWDMRQRLLRDKPAYSDWDLKLRAGGMIDIEFIAQTAQLTGMGRVSTHTYQALDPLLSHGFSQDDVDALKHAHHDYSAVVQMIRVAHGQKFDPEQASEPFKRMLAAVIGEANLTDLKSVLDRHAAHVHEILVRFLS